MGRIEIMDPNTLRLALGPVIIGVVEAAKQAGIPTKWLPLLSMLLGVIGGPLVGLVYGSANLGLDALTGFGIGAAATGIYALATNVGASTTVMNATPLAPDRAANSAVLPQ